MFDQFFNCKIFLYIFSIKLLEEEKTKIKKMKKSKIEISGIERLYTCVFFGEEGGLATTGLSLDELWLFL